MEEKIELSNDRRKPEFGTRYLTNPDQVYQHNAWDDVEWNADLTKEAEEKIKINSAFIVSSLEQEKYECEANIYWDKFYNVHQNRFFKDRHWLFTEFPELCIKSSVEKVENPVIDISEDIANTDNKNITMANNKICIWEVGCGVGNTVFPILKTNVESNVFVYCCDFSEVAISLVKDHPDFDAIHCHPFICDISAEMWDVPFKENSLDFILLIFVLSAIHPEKMQIIIDRLSKYLKPGGQILFRDYGRYDMVELRFKPGQCLTNHFYVRGDGTRVYFFTEDEVNSLFENAGLVKTQLYSSKRLQINRGKQLKMYRIWIQGKYMKPMST